MAKNDYDTILYKLLIYLYACLKREIVFDEDVFNSTVRKCAGNEQYFAEILDMAQAEGLITGVVVTRAWGNELIISSPAEDMKITAEGIHYIKENSQMKKAQETLKNSADIMAWLIKKVKI